MKQDLHEHFCEISDKHADLVRSLSHKIINVAVASTQGLCTKHEDELGDDTDSVIFLACALTTASFIKARAKPEYYHDFLHIIKELTIEDDE